MSVDINFYIEVKDDNGEWHLVKWYSDRHFDEYPEIEDGEKVVTINGKRYTEKFEKWTGLAWRDEACHGGYDKIASQGLPDDVSAELYDYLTNKYAALVKKHNEKVFGSAPENFGEYCRRFQYAYLNDMETVCHDKYEDWKAYVIGNIKKMNENEIIERLKVIETLVRGANPKVKLKETDYEDNLDYWLGEGLWDVMSLYEETRLLKETAGDFVGNRWIKWENVRVISYIS